MAAPTLAELARPESTALLLQEVQNGVMGPSSVLVDLAAVVARTGVIPNIARLVAAARTAGTAVVHCTAHNLPDAFGVNRNARLFAGVRKAGGANAPGSESVQPLPEIGLDPHDVVLPRYHGLSPMTGSPLDSLLRNQGITTVVLVGVSLNLAITNLTFDAINRAYQVVIPTDAVAGLPEEYGTAVLTHSLGLVATLTTTDALVAAWGG